MCRVFPLFNTAFWRFIRAIDSSLQFCNCHRDLHYSIDYNGSLFMLMTLSLQKLPGAASTGRPRPSQAGLQSPGWGHTAAPKEGGGGSARGLRQPVSCHAARPPRTPAGSPSQGTPGERGGSSFLQSFRTRLAWRRLPLRPHSTPVPAPSPLH